MNSRAQRRLMRQYEDQLRLERNGAPPPPDILAKMTKPKDPELLYQVRVDVKGEARPLPVGPKMNLEAAEMILVAVNSQIALGKLPAWGNTRVEAVQPS